MQNIEKKDSPAGELYNLLKGIIHPEDMERILDESKLKGPSKERFIEWVHYHFKGSLLKFAEKMIREFLRPIPDIKKMWEQVLPSEDYTRYSSQERKLIAILHKLGFYDYSVQGSISHSYKYWVGECYDHKKMMQDQDTPNDKLKSKNIDICGKSRQYGEHILRTICFFYATTSLRDYFLRAFKSPEFGFRPHAEFTSNEALINWLIDTHSTDSPVLGYMNYLLHEVSENISKDGFNFHFEKTNIEFYPEDIFLQTKELNKNINSQLHYPPPEDVRQTASNINKSVSDLLLSIRKIWEDDIIPRTIILRKVSKDDLRDVFNQYDGFDQDDNEVKIIECPEDLPLRKPILIVSETNPSIINFKYCSCPEELIFR